MITGFAFFLPLLVNRIKRVKIPVVIAEILAGIVFGKSGFHLIQNDLWITFLSLFGFSYLMFLSGVEVDFSLLKKLRCASGPTRNPLLLGILLFGLTLSLSYLLSSLLAGLGYIKSPLFMMLIFSTTSLGIVVPVPKEHRIINEPLGQIILLSALVADFATMLLIPVAMLLLRSGEGPQRLSSLLVFALFPIVLLISRRYLSSDGGRNPTYQNAQLRIRGAFALILLFVSLSEWVGAEFILGAFLAGLLFSLLFQDFRLELVPKLDAIGYGFLIPIFFITVGANFDLKTVLTLDTLISLPLYFCVAYVVKLIPVLYSKIAPPHVVKKEGIILAGCNDALSSLVGKLDEPDNVLILAESGVRVQNLFCTPGHCVLQWDRLDFSQLAALQDTTVKTMVAAYEEDDQTVQACEQAAAVGIPNIVALIQDPVLAHRLEKQGIHAVTPMKATHMLLFALIRYPDSFEVLYGSEDKNDIEVREFPYIPPHYVGLKLKELDLPGDCLVLMIMRDGKHIVPHGNTMLEPGDALVLIGNREHLRALDSLFKWNDCAGGSNTPQPAPE